MSTTQTIESMIAHLKRHPEDTLTRLAVADWMEENGENEKAGYYRTHLDIDLWKFIEHAGTIFRICSIEKVTLTGAEPCGPGQPFKTHTFAWYRRAQWNNGIPKEGDLPDFLFYLLPDTRSHHFWWDGESREECLEVLSNACLKWGRQEANRLSQ